MNAGSQSRGGIGVRLIGQMMRFRTTIHLASRVITHRSCTRSRRHASCTSPTLAGVGRRAVASVSSDQAATYTNQCTATLRKGQQFFLKRIRIRPGASPDWVRARSDCGRATRPIAPMPRSHLPKIDFRQGEDISSAIVRRPRSPRRQMANAALAVVNAPGVEPPQPRL